MCYPQFFFVIITYPSLSFSGLTRESKQTSKYEKDPRVKPEDDNEGEDDNGTEDDEGGTLD